MISVKYNNDNINIYEYADAYDLIRKLSRNFQDDVTPISKKGRGRHKIYYYNYPCSFDIETTTIRPGELNYSEGDSLPPVAFPYLFQWNIYGSVIFCRQYQEALDIFRWLSDCFGTGKNRRLVIFDHNLGYEYSFFKDLLEFDHEECFAMDKHHPVTLITNSGLMFRDSYKMTNMSLETLTMDWSKKWKKDKEIMNYQILRTPYSELDENTLIYSALDVLSLSDAIGGFLEARKEWIWTNCPTSTSFIRKELKKRVGVGVKKRNTEQRKYFNMLRSCRIDKEQYKMLKRLARGGNVHANRRYTGHALPWPCHFDIASSYPTQIVCRPEYPIGYWERFEPGTDIEIIEECEAKGYCCMFDVVLINAEVRPEVTVPYIPISKITLVRGHGSRFTDNGRYMGGLHQIRLTIFGAEWPIIKEQYGFDDVIVTDGYYAKKGYLPDIVRRYVLELYAKKTELKGVEGKEVEYALSKTYVNGVFGMMFTDPIRTGYEVTDNGIVEAPPKDIDEELKNYQKSTSYFLPYAWGAMVACQGRVFLQDMIDAVGQDFVYCDTDSIFALHPLESSEKIRELDRELKEYHRQCGMELTYNDIKGRPHELGSIEEEPFCCLFKTWGSKKYVTVENGELHCTVAGVPKKPGGKIIRTVDRFELGLIFEGKDTGKNCLWYNEDYGLDIRDDQGRFIETHSNVAMLPVDYLLSISDDYRSCLMIDGKTLWQFTDMNIKELEDFVN